MRKFVLALAIAAMLALPGLVFGQGAQIDVQDSGGGTEIDFNPLTDTSIVIDCMLTNTMTIGGAQYSLMAAKNGGAQSSGDADLKFAATPWVNGSLFGSGDYWAGVGANTNQGAGVTMAVVNGASGYSEMYFSMTSLAPQAGGLLASYELQPAVTLTVGDTYVIVANGDPPGQTRGNGWLNETGTGGGSWDDGTGLTVNIVPEPATALLLLGLLPFLRRRR